MESITVHPPYQVPNRRKNGPPAKGVVLKTAVGDAPELAYDEIVVELQEKLTQAQSRQTVISADRKVISLAAHMGSADDRARLDQLNQEGAVLSGENRKHRSRNR